MVDIHSVFTNAFRCEIWRKPMYVWVLHGFTMFCPGLIHAHPSLLIVSCPHNSSILTLCFPSSIGCMAACSTYFLSYYTRTGYLNLRKTLMVGEWSMLNTFQNLPLWIFMGDSQIPLPSEASSAKVMPCGLTVGCPVGLCGPYGGCKFLGMCGKSNIIQPFLDGGNLMKSYSYVWNLMKSSHAQDDELERI